VIRTLPANGVDESQLAQLDKARSALPSDSPLAQTLDYLVATVRSGQDVTIVRDDVRLTPNQAAKLLGMSRTHLYKLLDAEVIASVNVGRDRRITVKALWEYQERMDRDKADLALRFAHRDANRSKLLDHLAASAPEDG
jgi:excisionase family DNA binding protein